MREAETSLGGGGGLRWGVVAQGGIPRQTQGGRYLDSSRTSQKMRQLEWTLSVTLMSLAAYPSTH